MWQLLPPTALLLLVFSSTGAGLQKAVVILNPQWVRVLQEDRLTLQCQGAGDNSTQWFHNGNLISNQNSSYVIETARVSDTGEYKCQTGLSNLSDPVRLEVHGGWLALQTSQWVFQEGEPIRMKCHSWRNKTLYRVTYLQNGRGKKFFHRNSEFYIPKATKNHNGSYFCRGLIGSKNVSSESVNIIVQGPETPSTSLISLPWHQIAFCLLIGLLFAVDTGLYFSIQRNLQSSNWKEPKVQWSRNPQDK